MLDKFSPHPRVYCSDGGPIFERDLKGKLSEIAKSACQALIREADTLARHFHLEHLADAAEYRRKRDLQLAEDRFRQNLHVPLHKLPVEIFSRILVFRQIIEEDRSTAISGLRLTASVARYWRHVVLSTPQLWSYLSDTMSSVHQGWCFERSKTVPLDLDFRYSKGMNDPIHQKALNLSHRWRSLRVSRVGLSKPFQVCLGTCVPLLQYLDLDPYNPGHNAPLYQLSDGLDLRTVALSGCAVPWDSSRLRGLTSLKLWRLGATEGPTMSQLIAILQASPSLETLQLFVITVAVSAEDECDAATLAFPDLAKLRLYDVPTRFTDCLMRHISFPLSQLRQLEISPQIECAPPPTIMAFDYSSPAFVEQFRRVLNPIDTVHITTSKDAVKMACRAEWSGAQLQAPFELVVPTSGPTQQLKGAASVAKLVRSAISDNNVIVWVRSGLQDEEIAGQVVGMFGSATRVSFPEYDVAIGAATFLKYLAQRCAGNEDGEAGWNFPRLKYLSIQGAKGVGVANIRKIVRDRWVKVTGTEEEGAKDIEGAVEVRMPITRAGRIEVWRPNPKVTSRGRQPQGGARKRAETAEHEEQEATESSDEG